MFGRRLTQYALVWCSDEDDKTYLERELTKWPLPLETDNNEVWDGGGAAD